MVKKLKVVDVAQTEEAPKVEEPIMDEVEAPVVEEPSKEIIEEITPLENTPTEDVKPTENIKPEKKSSKGAMQEIVCEHCSKKMLMKTYKYSHQKICRANIKEPTPEPPKPQAAISKKQPEAQDKSGTPPNAPTASFDAYSPPANTYLREWNDLRQQRQMVRQQRVKSLISQAI